MSAFTAGATRGWSRRRRSRCTGGRLGPGMGLGLGRVGDPQDDPVAVGDVERHGEVGRPVLDGVDDVDDGRRRDARAQDLDRKGLPSHSGPRSRSSSERTSPGGHGPARRPSVRRWRWRRPAGRRRGWRRTGGRASPRRPPARVFSATHSPLRPLPSGKPQSVPCSSVTPVRAGAPAGVEAGDERGRPTLGPAVEEVVVAAVEHLQPDHLLPHAAVKQKLSNRPASRPGWLKLATTAGSGQPVVEASPGCRPAAGRRSRR